MHLQPLQALVLLQHCNLRTDEPSLKGAADALVELGLLDARGDGGYQMNARTTDAMDRITRAVEDGVWPGKILIPSHDDLPLDMRFLACINSLSQVIFDGKEARGAQVRVARWMLDGIC